MGYGGYGNLWKACESAGGSFYHGILNYQKVNQSMFQILVFGREPSDALPCVQSERRIRTTPDSAEVALSPSYGSPVVSQEKSCGQPTGAIHGMMGKCWKIAGDYICFFTYMAYHGIL